MCVSAISHGGVAFGVVVVIDEVELELKGKFDASGVLVKSGTGSMVQTIKTDHFFKLAPFRSPLTDLLDFGIAGKLLTSATRRCSPFVDSVLRI